MMRTWKMFTKSHVVCRVPVSCSVERRWRSSVQVSQLWSYVQAPVNSVQPPEVRVRQGAGLHMRVLSIQSQEENSPQVTYQVQASHWILRVV